MSHLRRDGQDQTVKRELLDIGMDGVDALIRQWIIGDKAERNREILRRHLFAGRTYEELEEEFGVSSRQIGTICRKCEDILAKHMPRA